MNKKNVKNLLKAAAILYVASFLLVNWSEVSWIFNYRQVYGMVNGFFNPYLSVDKKSIQPYFFPNQASQQAKQPVLEVKTAYTAKQNTLEVPKLSLEVPIIFSTNSETSAIMKDLDSGVVFYPGSVYPGQQGQIVILGHSAPPGWPKIKKDWVFSELDKLAAGDLVLIDLNNKQYSYKVTQKSIIGKGKEVPAASFGKSTLALISCWPPGKDYQRIVVVAEIIGQD